jgi:hypothetical protein
MVREAAVRLRAMTLAAIGYATVLSMGLFLTCEEVFAEDLSASSRIVGCRNYVSSSKDDLLLQALVEFAAGACAPKGATNMQVSRSS